MVNDRFTRGFIAGVIGGVLMNTWGFISYYLVDFSELKFTDWTGMILFSKLPETTFEISLALVIHLFFVGALGVIFAFLIPEISSENYMLKSVVFAIIIGFSLYAIPKLFELPKLYYTAPKTVASNILGA